MSYFVIGLISAGVVFPLLTLLTQYTKSFAGELLVSFLPLVILLNLIVLVPVCYAAISQPEPSSNVVPLLALAVIFLILGAARLLYFSIVRPADVTDKSSNLRLLSFNKLVTNREDEAIANHINQLKPDIIGLLEVKSGMSNFYKKQLLLSHSINFRYQSGVGEYLLLSRYPLQKTELVPIDTYGAIVRAAVLIKGRTIFLYLVHTTAPLTPPRFQERNRGLAALALILKQKQPGSKLIFGDFNLTPWSPFYKTFHQAVSQQVYNLAQGRGLFFTWRILRPFSAHIDHVFASSDIKIQKFQVDESLGSDHRIVIADVET